MTVEVRPKSLNVIENYNQISNLPLVFFFIDPQNFHSKLEEELFSIASVFFLDFYLFIPNFFNLIPKPKVIRGDSNYLLIFVNELHLTLALADVSVPYQLLSELNQTGHSQHHNKMTMKTQQ